MFINSDIKMKDESNKPFGKKEFLETLIVVIVTLFLVCVGFTIPDFFLLILLILAVFLITILLVFRQKRNK